MLLMGQSATKSLFALLLGILTTLVLPSSAKAQGCNPLSAFATPILGSPGGCPLVVDYVAPLYSNGNISAVAVADFNGDGKMDVAMALNGGNDNYAVAVLSGNGDGTFSGPFFSAPCCNPDLRGVNWIVAGDFNRDGKADVAIGTSDGYAAILLGNGDGTFTLKNYWGVTPCCSGPQAGAVGDFNGDGNLDLLVTTANVTSPGVSYFYPGNGDGTFNTNALVVIAVGSNQNRPVSIAVGDFNHDGHLDFATMNNAGGGPNTVSVVLGNGDGTFQPAVDDALLNPGRGDGITDSVSIVAGDFNGDGYLDLATLDKLNSGVSVLLNNGDGTFKVPVIYGSAVPWNNGLCPQQIAVGDFNHDGYLDIVFIASQQGAAAVLFGNGDGTFKPAVTYVTDVNPDTVAVGDFNGDGIADFVVGTNYNEGITIALSNGEGTFKGARNYVPWIISNSYYGWGNGAPNPISVAFGDFNSDGKPDLAVADGSNFDVTIFANNGNGSFTESANYRTTLTQYAYQPTLVRVADLNRDGKLDLVVGGGGNSFGTMLGNGDGTFQPPLLYSSGLGRASSLAIVDVNGDGIPDVIFNSPDGYYNAPPGTQETAYVALGNGDGTFPAPIATSVFCVPWGPVQYVAVVDLNGDGKLDLAATCAPDGNNNRPTTIFVLLGNGDGTFGAASAIPANAFPTIIAAGDFNEDGKQDLVVGNNYPAPAQFSLLLGNGDGTFQNPVAYSVLPSWWTNPAPTPWPLSFAIADFNHDGHLDVLVGDYNGTVGDSATGLPYNQGVQLLLGNGDGTLQAPQLFLAGRYAYDMAVADIKGDGSADVAIADGVDSAVTILLNQIPSVSLQTIAVTPNPASVAAGLTQQFTATGHYTDGSTQDVTATATWSSSNTAIATINSAGLATGVTQGGPVTITASQNSISGPAQLTVTAPVLQSITVSPSPASVAAGLTVQFTATGHYSDSSTQDLTTSVTWSSSNTGIATVTNAAGSQGLARGVSAGGPVTITATQNGTSGTAQLTVTAPVLQSISVSPASASVPKGLTQQFTATGHYSDGSTQNLTTSVTWSSSNTAIATISNTAGSQGVATAVSVGGPVTITATQGVSGTAQMTVTAAAPTSVVVTPANAQIPVGASQQYAAMEMFSDGTGMNVTKTAMWASANTSVATISKSGLAKAMGLGSSTISATYKGMVGSRTLTTYNLTVSPSSATITVGSTQQFTAMANFANGSAAPVTSGVTWSSSNMNVATINSSGLAKGLKSGKATIKATVMAVSSSASLTVK